MGRNFHALARLGVALTFACAVTLAHADFNRSEVIAIIGDWRKIVTPNGVEELLEIPIADTKQWISVRGRDRSNPILLMIHGGPASPEIPSSWAFQDGWEDFFTVVQWDQRGSGKTFLGNDPEKIAPTLTLDRITEDAAEVVRYLRSHYQKDKVFVLGHSWGSLVGLSLAKRHPEMLYAYVGMGQIVNGRANEVASYAQTLRLAEQANNTEALNELKLLAPYPEADGSVPLDKLGTERKWVMFFGGLTYGRKDWSYYERLFQFSPAYTSADVAAVDKGSALSLPRLFPDLLQFDVSGVTQWQCPIVLFLGRHDLTTPSTVAAEWFGKIRAPKKKLVWFENSAHMMMVEEPGYMLVHLVQDVRPLAR
jgi:pimeloyl-ACP methyl ester carboxylesterase